MRLTAALIQMGSNQARSETLCGDSERDQLATRCTELADVAKHQQAEIFAQQARFDEMEGRFSGSKVAAIFLDAAMRIQFFTPAISQFFHLIDTDLGRPVADLLNGDADQSMASAARRVAEGRDVAAVQVQTADGTWYRRQTLAYRHENSRTIGVILTFEDITDLKRDCMRLEQSRRQSVRNAAADQRHTAQVSHHLRQPLLALTLLRERLSKRAGSAEDRVLVEQLRAQLCSVSDMVDSLTNDRTDDVDMANHPTASVAKLSIASRFGPISDLAYCDDHVQQFSHAHSDLVLILAQDGNTPPHLVQALNAAGYQVTIVRTPASITGMTQHGAAMPDIGVIDLDALDTGERAFAKELRDRIGTMLPLLFLTNDVSLCATDRTAPTGCEILMKSASAQQILRAVHRLLCGERGHRYAEPEAQHGRAVFLIDHDPIARAAARLALESAGHIVHEYANGEDFIEIYRPEFASCLVIDANLPGMTGLEVLRWIRAAGDPLPTIFLTRYSEVPIAVQAMKAGASDFIVKPGDSCDLGASVQRAISKSGAIDKASQPYSDAVQRFKALTPREHQIMEMVLDGQASKCIAAVLAISQRTVENHRAAIMKKTGSKSLPALARFAGNLPH